MTDAFDRKVLSDMLRGAMPDGLYTSMSQFAANLEDQYADLVASHLNSEGVITFHFGAWRAEFRRAPRRPCPNCGCVGKNGEG